jgi:hypothetical protein
MAIPTWPLAYLTHAQGVSQLDTCQNVFKYNSGGDWPSPSLDSSNYLQITAFYTWRGIAGELEYPKMGALSIAPT